MIAELLERGGAIEGVKQVLLSVATTQAAVGLYRSLGFEAFGREPHALKMGDRFIDEEHMVLRLEKDGAWLEGPVSAGKDKKRPRLIGQGRLGSPPPELPNHEMDAKIHPTLCKRHFGNANSGKLSCALTEVTWDEPATFLAAFARSAKVVREKTRGLRQFRWHPSDSTVRTGTKPLWSCVLCYHLTVFSSNCHAEGR